MSSGWVNLIILTNFKGVAILDGKNYKIRITNVKKG